MTNTSNVKTFAQYIAVPTVIGGAGALVIGLAASLTFAKIPWHRLAQFRKAYAAYCLAGEIILPSMLALTGLTAGLTAGLFLVPGTDRIKRTKHVARNALPMGVLGGTIGLVGGLILVWANTRLRIHQLVKLQQTYPGTFALSEFAVLGGTTLLGFGTGLGIGTYFGLATYNRDHTFDD